MRGRWAAICAVLAVASCAPPGSKDPFVGFGPNPPLPKPRSGLIPQVGIPKIVGWAAGAAPRAPEGFTITRYAEGLDHPRWLLVLPNGDVLAAQGSAPPSEGNRMNRGIKGWFKKQLMKKVKSAVPSPNRITLLRDADGDGVAEMRTTYAQGLTTPFGITLGP